jgi:SNF2 family DNA or RNA helicase
MSEWIIAQPLENIEITAASDALWICDGKSLLDDERAEMPDAASRLGKMLPVLIPQMLELDLASVEGRDVRLKYDQLASLPDYEIDAFAELFEPSPFTLEVKTIGALGFASNRYNINFYLDSNRVNPEIRGCLLKFQEKIYLLDRKSFELTAAANSFNESPPEEKASGEAFRQFAEIKNLAAASHAETDKFMENRRIVMPSQIGVELIEEEHDRISFAPKIEGISNANFQAAVKRIGSAKEIYSFDGDAGEKISVVLNDEQREVLTRMQNVRHLSGVEKTQTLRDPQSVFDGVMQSVNLDDFGPRVRGIGDFPFVVQPYIQKSVTGIFDDVVREHAGAAPKFNAGLHCRYADGSEQVVQFKSPAEINDFVLQVNEAFRSGKGQIEYAGKSISIDKRFVESIKELSEKVQPKQKNDEVKPPVSGKYLLIYTNEEEIEFEQSAEESASNVPLEIPSSLKREVSLKDHQKKGIQWLQHNFRLNRQGCLLADDMGLGKTLQLLVFLAWLIEQNNVITGSADPQLPPWKPILIVAPVILIENETWIGDMQKFFSGDGAIFMPWLTLRGAELKKMKKQSGQETKLGESILDLDRLRQHRVILTNYETVINYQHSFAKMRDDWSVIITDEAQEYKTPNTKISHALKSLSPRFRVACTGTPVETRLFDVWNIFDFLQPGKLLGSAKNFCDRYEKPLEAVEETRAAIEELKEKLHFGQSSAYILRRDKKELHDLPKKTEHRIDCELSPAQREFHLNLLHRASLGGQGNHPFSLVSDFLRVYQHPALAPHYNPRLPAQAIEECDKLRVLIETLKSIKLKGEKALIFTRSLDMQQILVSVLNYRFGISVNIINGSTKRSNSNTSKTLTSADKTRRGIIERFQNSEGFNVLILSPEVAGMGLTLTEANHVFHYGRWWNPAKEAQATDRVYRIGQEKDVHIYYLIAKDKQRKLETFDEKLDLLLRRRLALASDFLAPIPSEDDLTSEFLADLFKS